MIVELLDYIVDHGKIDVYVQSDGMYIWDTDTSPSLGIEALAIWRVGYEWSITPIMSWSPGDTVRIYIYIETYMRVYIYVYIYCIYCIWVCPNILQ